MNDKITKGHYKASVGAFFNDGKAAVYGAEIEKIMDANPGVNLIPDMVLDAAADLQSPLHDYFEWDDSVCARRYRLRQAEEMITHIRVVIMAGDKQVVQRAFINVSVDDGEEAEEYVPVRKFMTSPDLKERALKKAMKELEKWCVRYNHLHELDVVFRAVKSIDSYWGNPDEKTRLER